MTTFLVTVVVDLLAGIGVLAIAYFVLLFLFRTRDYDQK